MMPSHAQKRTKYYLQVYPQLYFKCYLHKNAQFMDLAQRGEVISLP